MDVVEGFEGSLSEAGGVYGHADADDAGWVTDTGGGAFAVPDDASFLCIGHPGYRPSVLGMASVRYSILPEVSRLN